MKKLSLGFAILLLTGMSVFALWHRSPVTPEHELSLQLLASRYIDAFCHNPRALSAVISENTTLSPTLLWRTVNYLEELIEQEGACYGRSKRELKNEVTGAIYELADFLLDADMATELGVVDFYDCLVGIERSFSDLADSSRRIIECVELLDIRGFWYNALVKGPEPEYPVLPEPVYPVLPEPQPIEIVYPAPITDPVVMDPCYDECLNECKGIIGGGEPGLIPKA